MSGLTEEPPSNAKSSVLTAARSSDRAQTSGQSILLDVPGAQPMVSMSHSAGLVSDEQGAALFREKYGTNTEQDGPSSQVGTYLELQSHAAEGEEPTMDPRSLGILLIFKVCLDYFDYFKTATYLHSDCQILLLKLDFEHERMIIWGEKHGIFSTIGDAHYNPELDNPQISNRLSKALGLINLLFSNGERLKSQYGVKLLEDDHHETNDDNGPNEKFVSTSALKRISQWRKTQKANGNSEKRPSLLEKTKWAIRDKAKFEALTRHIRELVSGLYDVLPVPDKERNKIALGDIKDLFPDIGRLKQVEEASEDIYPAWSEAASIIVLASEMGSLWSASASNHRNIQQAVQQTFDAQESEDEQGRYR